MTNISTNIGYCIKCASRSSSAYQCLAVSKCASTCRVLVHVRQVFSLTPANANSSSYLDPIICLTLDACSKIAATRHSAMLLFLELKCMHYRAYAVRLL